MGGFAFELLATDGAARRARLLTPHGAVDTPAFMPVATLGTVKSLAPGDIRAAGAQMVLANTYHLFLRPGPEIVAIGLLLRRESMSPDIFCQLICNFFRDTPARTS